jgi:hypothetical protein
MNCGKGLSGFVRNALAFRPREIFVALWFFTGYSNRQLYGRVKLPDAFTGKFHSGQSCPSLKENQT